MDNLISNFNLSFFSSMYVENGIMTNDADEGGVDDISDFYVNDTMPRLMFKMKRQLNASDMYDTEIAGPRILNFIVFDSNTDDIVNISSKMFAFDGK